MQNGVQGKKTGQYRAVQEDTTDNSGRGMTMIAGEEEELELLVVEPVCAGFVYHDFEKSGIQYINILGERGYENVFLLSGGIEDFMMSYGNLIEGKNIPKCENKNPKPIGKPERLGGHGMLNGNGKVELYRQGQFKKKSESQYFFSPQNLGSCHQSGRIKLAQRVVSLARTIAT